MSPTNKYIVEYNENDYEIFTTQDLCKKFNISESTLKNIIIGTCKYNTDNTRPLKDYKIYYKLENAGLKYSCMYFKLYTDISYKNELLEIETFKLWMEVIRLELTEEVLTLESDDKKFKLIKPDGIEYEYDNFIDLKNEVKVSNKVIYSIIKGECKFNHVKTKHLKGIKIISSGMKINVVETEINKILLKIEKINKVIEENKKEYNRLKELYKLYRD